MHDPIKRFNVLWQDARRQSTQTHRNAVCVSTIDESGYPNSRFVDLKAADERGFVFCTSLASAKGQDLARDPRAGLTLWWEVVALQVRVKGLCAPISGQEADQYWTGRPRSAQLATVAFAQSHPLSSEVWLAETYAQITAEHAAGPVSRPDDWGGFRLQPEQIEFLEFRENRLHVRTLYERVDGQWSRRFLQP